MSKGCKVFGVVFLMSTVFGGGLIGPVTNLLYPDSALVKQTWRMGILVIYFLIPSIIESMYTEKSVYRDFFKWKQYGLFLINNFFFFFFAFGIVYASTEIIQVQAYIFNTSCGQFIVLYSVLMCKPVVKLEIIAVLVSVVGQICMIVDPNAERVDGKTGSFTAYSAAILSGAAGGAYFLMSNHLTKSVPMCFFFFILSLH